MLLHRPLRLKLIVAALCLNFVHGQALLAEKPTPDWVRVTDEAEWQPRDSQGELVYDGKLWIFGGWFDSYEAPPRDVWSSADGKSWQLVEKSAPWKHSDLSMSVTFHDRMWFMGGWYNGRLPGHSASNMVWSSNDGVKWDQETDNAGWSPRLASALVVHEDKMWILGGTENYYFGDDSSLRNDVWSSTNGKEWTLVTDSAAWAPRAYHQAAVLNGRIYVFGGGNYVPEYRALNDVWSSADGVTWRLETEAAPWSPRLWFSSAVYRDHIWVIGGWSNNPSTNLGDVWYSKDGKSWKQFESKVQWKERHEHSVFVFQDKLWVVGGHARPLDNDVWSIQIDKDWFGED
ncbi:MAG: galactose oxidase [Planctomycetaceae bacterium]